jgi:hypothetical protein
MGEMRNAYRILVGITNGKKQFGRPRPENIRMDLTKAGWKGVKWLKILTSDGLL